MSNDTQARLEKLDRLEKNARARSKRYLEKAKSEGKKQFSAIISGEAYNEINRLRDAAQLAGKGASFGTIIEKALFYYSDSLKTSDKKVNVNSDVSRDIKSKQHNNIEKNVNSDVYTHVIKETQTEIEAPVPDRSNREAYRVWLFHTIKALKDSGLTWDEVTDKLNADGVLMTSGKPFGKTTASVFYSRNKVEMGEKH